MYSPDVHALRWWWDGRNRHSTYHCQAFPGHGCIAGRCSQNLPQRGYGVEVCVSGGASLHKHVHVYLCMWVHTCVGTNAANATIYCIINTNSYGPAMQVWRCRLAKRDNYMHSCPKGTHTVNIQLVYKARLGISLSPICHRHYWIFYGLDPCEHPLANF